MSDNYVLDDEIFDEIARGNADLANYISRLSKRPGVILWMTNAQYNEWTKIDANKRLASDLNIKHQISDSRGPENMQMQRLGKDLNAFLITLDSGHVARYRAAGGKTPPDMPAVTATTGAMNYHVARRLLGLKPLNINGASGKIYPATNPQRTTKNAVNPRPTHKIITVNDPLVGKKEVPVPIKPPQSKDGTVRVKTPTSQVGPKVEAPKEMEAPQASKAGRAMESAQLILSGANYVIQKINDRIQKKRFEERWAQIRPNVESTLAADPQQGALIMVYYSKREKTGAENETPLDHVTVFQDIAVAYGQTREDARMRFAARPRMAPAGAGAMIVDDSIFHPPTNPVDVSKLWVPFTKGFLATFVPGREEFVAVKWGGVMGFDDKFGSDKVDVGAGVRLKFMILWPPDEIHYMDGKLKSKSINWTLSYTHWQDPNLDFYTGSPFIELDSWINPASKLAAMVYPADNMTARFFKSTPKTRDNNGQLRSYGMDLVRWVRPQNLWVLETL